MKLSDVIEFRKDLFFEGAVQISWFESDPKRRDLAASHFVFHGPDYHGVSDADIEKDEAFSLIDTASFTKEIITYLDPNSDTYIPLSLAIAGWGTGKSHLGLTLATLLSDPTADVSKKILKNLHAADVGIERDIRNIIEAWNYPTLILPINGMDNFDLSAELSRQVLKQLREHDCDTTSIEDLSPRFHVAATFVERNFELRTNDFTERFDSDSTAESIVDLLNDRDENAYKKVNEVYEIATGNSIPATGQESPRQLIQTLCGHYCGDDGPFQNILIIFDEFGRYLEFAAEKPHLAGDAALQQLFEGVQDNADKCLLQCFIQYDLKAYVSRVSYEKRDSINRFIGRYDSGKKYYLSTNLETLFANLIEKKSTDVLEEYSMSDQVKNENLQVHSRIQKWLPSTNRHAVWQDSDRFQKIVCQGCWPLHPLGTWLLCSLAGEGSELQQRSAVTFIERAYEKFKKKSLNLDKGSSWTISAVQLSSKSLIEELRIAEEAGHRGAVVHSYLAAVHRYRNDFTPEESSSLLAVLLSSKIGIKIENKKEASEVIALLSQIPSKKVNAVIKELQFNYNVLEWSDRFKRYEIIGDAVPKSEFVSFLRKKSQRIPLSKIEEIYTLNMKNWGKLANITPDFASVHNISTVEWAFQSVCTSSERINNTVSEAIQDWKNAIRTDQPRGQIIYCYLQADSGLDESQDYIKNCLQDELKEADCPERIPFIIVIMHDDDGKLKRALAEYWILNNDLTDEEGSKYSNFIKDYMSQLDDEFRTIAEKMIQDRLYIYPEAFKIEPVRLKKMADNLFQETYPKIIPFPFDGFSTPRGNAAKNCREITVELFKGTLDYDGWISTCETQLKNRTMTLLDASWGALGDDGKIVWTPRHSGVKEIITLLDQKLQNDGTISAGEIFTSLIKPPYGFNIASAGLMLGVFISPRKDSSVLIYKGKELSGPIWVSKAFSGNFLNIDVLNETFLRHISDSESSQWVELLGKWDSEPTHSGRLNYMYAADELKENVPIPGDLHDRWVRLNESSEKSFKAVASYNSFLEKQNEYYFKAFEKENASSLSYVGFQVQERLEKMKREAEVWTPDQLSALKPIIDQVKQAVIQLFPLWLKYQTILKPQQIGEFRFKMIDQCGKNLKTLGLKELHNQLIEHVNTNISKIEELEKISFIVDETNAFLRTHRVDKTTKISVLKDWKRNCKELTEGLTKAKRSQNIPKLSSLLERVDEFKNNCQKQIETHANELGQLEGIEFLSIHDVQVAKVNVQNLREIFVGEEMDMEYLAEMDSQLKMFERDMRVWSDFSITNEHLKEAVKIRIAECLEMQSEEDPPPWDTETAYGNFLEIILNERHTAAKKWYDEVYVAPNMIKQMPAEKCHELHDRIEAKPAYIDSTQINSLNKLQEAIDKRLDGLQIEGLLVRFKKLSKKQKAEFLSLAKAELSN